MEESLHKKRKTDEDAEDGVKLVLKYIERVKGDFITFNGKAEFVTQLFESDKLLAGLQDSFYSADLSTGAGLLYVPDDQTLTIERNRVGEIVFLKFADGSGLSGTSLRKLGIMLTLKNTGYAGLVWDLESNHGLGGLAFPPCNVYSGSGMIIEDKNATVQFIAYYAKNHKCNHARRLDLCTVLEIEEVGLRDMKPLMSAMSQLTSVAPGTEFEKPSLDYAVGLLKSPDVKRFTSSYATTLIGVFAKKSSLEERVKTFATYGSTAPFGQTLLIPRPYAKDLFNDELEPLNKKLMSELTDDDEVVCSILPISAQYHSNVKLSDSVQIKPDGGYGVKHNKKLQKANDLMIVKGSLIRAIAESIVKARKVTVLGGNLENDANVPKFDDVAI